MSLKAKIGVSAIWAVWLVLQVAWLSTARADIAFEIEVPVEHPGDPPQGSGIGGEYRMVVAGVLLCAAFVTSGLIALRAIGNRQVNRGKLVVGLLIGNLVFLLMVYFLTRNSTSYLEWKAKHDAWQRGDTKTITEYDGPPERPSDYASEQDAD